MRAHADTALREKVAQQVAEISARPSNDPETKTTVAQAQFELGNHKEAEAAVDAVGAAGRMPVKGIGPPVPPSA